MKNVRFTPFYPIPIHILILGKITNKDLADIITFFIF